MLIGNIRMPKQNCNYVNPINRSIENPFNLQHNYSYYISPSYLSPERMSSYGYQYLLGMSTDCQSFLNIGNANHIIKDLFLLNRKNYLEIDIDHKTNPSINAVLPRLPLKSHSFEVVMCFQVLEHMPYEFFQSCIQELQRVSKKYIILSLPDISLSRRDKIKMVLFSLIKHPREWKKFRFRSIEKEHFWEIDNQNQNYFDIERIIKSENLAIEQHFRNHLNPYHHFFVLRKNDCKTC